MVMAGLIRNAGPVARNGSDVGAPASRDHPGKVKSLWAESDPDDGKALSTTYGVVKRSGVSEKYLLENQ
jgi:hypothetical protein